MVGDKMYQTSLTTIGREIYPGLEVKISCVMGVDHLDYKCLNDRYRIIYVKEGHGVFRNGENMQFVTSPSILCINESDIIEINSAINLQMDIMYFEPSCFERYIEYDSIEDLKSSLKDDTYFFRAFFERNESYIGACQTNHYLGNRVSRLIELTDMGLKEQKDSLWPCRSRSYFIELLLLANSIYNEDEANEKIYLGQINDEIKNVISWLNINYMDKIRLETVTKQFHTNKTTLNRKFKSVMGITIMEYISSLRMQIACSLLRKTYLTINDIMERAGYKDDAHFLRSFKKYAGCTPSEYRSRFSNS